MTIAETFLKIKPPDGSRKILTGARILGEIAILCLVLGGIFLLGRISVLAGKRRTAPVEIIYPPLILTNIPKYPVSGSGEITPVLPVSTESMSWNFAASKSGKVYYPKNCAGLNRIQPENLVYFETEDLAIASKRSLAKTCAN